MMRIMEYGAAVLMVYLFFGQMPDVSAAPPYAANGFGMEVRDDVGRARGMGGSGSADADGFNIVRGNPALNSAVRKYTFTFGAAYNRGTTDIDGVGSVGWAKTDAELLSLAVPLFRGLVFGWGLYPLTKTDVRMSQSSVQNGQTLSDKTIISGGVNLSSMSLSGSFKGFLRYGYSFNYNFGAIQEEWRRTFPNDSGLNGSLYYLKRKYSGYSHTVGAIVDIGRHFSTGFGYTTEASLDKNTDVVMRNITNDPIRIGQDSASYPANWRFGVYGRSGGRFSGGVDVAFESWKDAADSGMERTYFNNTYTIGAGLRYVPQSRQSDPFYRKLPLTVGVRTGTLYYDSYPVVDTVKEHALTLGVEFPLKNDTGSLFTSFEGGIRGNKAANGWRDVFTGFSIVLVGKIL